MELSVEFVFTPSRLCAGMLMLSSLGDMVFPNLSTSPSSHHTGLENLGRYIRMYMCLLTSYLGHTLLMGRPGYKANVRCISLPLGLKQSNFSPSHHTALENFGWYIHMCMCLLTWYPGNTLLMGEAWV